MKLIRTKFETLRMYNYGLLRVGRERRVIGAYVNIGKTLYQWIWR